MILRLFLKFVRHLCRLFLKKTAEIRPVRKSKFIGYLSNGVLTMDDQPLRLQYDPVMNDLRTCLPNLSLSILFSLLELMSSFPA